MTKLKPNIPVDKWIEEKDMRIVRKMPMMMDERKFHYISDDRNEYMKLTIENTANQNERILYLDRDLLSKKSDPGVQCKGLCLIISLYCHFHPQGLHGTVGEWLIVQHR